MIQKDENTEVIDNTVGVRLSRDAHRVLKITAAREEVTMSVAIMNHFPAVD